MSEVPAEIRLLRREAARCRSERNKLRALFAETDTTSEQDAMLVRIEDGHRRSEAKVRKATAAWEAAGNLDGQDLARQLATLEQRRREMENLWRLMVTTPAGSSHRGAGSARHVGVARGPLL